MPFGYLSALDAIEQQAINGLALCPDAMPVVREGVWKDAVVTLRVSRWTGPKVALFRTARLTGEAVEIVNVIGFARAPSSAPILGIDLVAVRSDSGVVVADLSPLGPGVSHPALPGWAQGIFSAAPLIERVTPDTAPAAVSSVMSLLARFIDGVNSAPPAADAQARRDAVERYRDGHLADERMTTMLAHMFGKAQAAALMREVLFPRIEEVDVHA